MENQYSESLYEDMLHKLFTRFPSFQKVGAGAYKPGIANMEFADQLMGHPHRNYKVIHVAGTNGKGSVSNMLASCLAAAGLRVGLYTSPHIVDFRERIRIVTDTEYEYIPKEDVWDFVCQWHDTFDHLDLSFFEITTLMALHWFSEQSVDVAILETGLGGRLDSTNIVTPVLSVITNIGYDHCDLLGDTLPEIAFEKAGIIKPKVPVVVGESNPETDVVFERKVLYVNLPEPCFMGNREEVMSLLVFADKVTPMMWDRHEDMLHDMDLRGEYQKSNLRTVLAALEIISSRSLTDGTDVLTSRTNGLYSPTCMDALVHTAARTGFRGRWEKLSEDPFVICDIGHNEHGLKYNFAQLDRMRAEGECTHLIIVYGSVADKDVDAVLHRMPADAIYIFTQAQGKRAMAASDVCRKYQSFCMETGRSVGQVHVTDTVAEAVEMAKMLVSGIVDADDLSRPLVYIGGSTYVVSEAIGAFEK